MRLAENIAFVTGGAGGIGGAVCSLFAAEGARVIVADQDITAAEKVAENLPNDAFAIHLDVADEASWKNAAAEIEKICRHIDILVNSAGVSGFGNIDDIDYAFWTRFQKINADSIFLSVKYMLPLLRKANAASIVNMGSTQGLQPNPSLPAYSASKGSLRALSKSLALYFANSGDNIRCNTVHPGSTLTPMMEANLGDTEEERKTNYQSRIDAHPLGKVLGRIVLPEDIAKACLFLASSDAEFITGVDLPVDGGATAFC